jgi:hypothetical protein
MGISRKNRKKEEVRSNSCESGRTVDEKRKSELESSPQTGFAARF